MSTEYEERDRRRREEGQRENRENMRRRDERLRQELLTEQEEHKQYLLRCEQKREEERRHRETLEALKSQKKGPGVWGAIAAGAAGYAVARATESPRQEITIINQVEPKREPEPTPEEIEERKRRARWDAERAEEDRRFQEAHEEKMAAAGLFSDEAWEKFITPIKEAEGENAKYVDWERVRVSVINTLKNGKLTFQPLFNNGTKLCRHGCTRKSDGYFCTTLELAYDEYRGAYRWGGEVIWGDLILRWIEPEICMEGEIKWDQKRPLPLNAEGEALARKERERQQAEQEESDRQAAEKAVETVRLAELQRQSDFWKKEWERSRGIVIIGAIVAILGLLVLFSEINKRNLESQPAPTPTPIEEAQQTDSN
jgi:hypothetical protein